VCQLLTASSLLNTNFGLLLTRAQQIRKTSKKKMCNNGYVMNEKQTEAQVVRPTKKQRELLNFIQTFINEHGYSPSYREIMTGLNYTSVATVSLHVNNLIKRGHLRKRDHSARSLELVGGAEPAKVTSNKVEPGEEKWLVEKVEHAFSQVEQAGSELAENSLDHLYVLIGALKVLGLEGAAQSYLPRLTALKQKQAV
jgi:3-dehydroquinate dehydratase